MNSVSSSARELLLLRRGNDLMKLEMIGTKQRHKKIQLLTDLANIEIDLGNHESAKAYAAMARDFADEMDDWDLASFYERPDFEALLASLSETPEVLSLNAREAALQARILALEREVIALQLKAS